MTSDWEILFNARSGDQTACKVLFKNYYKSLVRMTSLITGSLDSAKDVTQETFIRLLERKIKHTKGNLKSYITTVAYRLALKEVSRARKNSNISEDIFTNGNNTQIDIFINKENQKHIYQVITTLPEHQKEILILRFYGKISYEDISVILEIPLGTVKSKIFYAVKACREKLKERGVIE